MNSPRSLKTRSSRRKRVARSPLQTLFESVKVVSLANGTLMVTAKWRGVREYTEQEGGGPGLFTRLTGARRLQVFINRHLKQIHW